jgi:DNA-binding response OmpR family regulator
MTAHILLVEHDISLANFIKLELEYVNYSVTISPRGLTVFNFIENSVYDLIIIERNLSDVSGLEVCRRLRQKKSRTPIILLTDHDSIDDRTAALDAGADDYLVKKFTIDELLGRISAHLRLQTTEEVGLVKFADIRLNQHSKEVYRGQRLLDLTTKEFDLLEYLICNARQVLSREQILAQVWGYDFNGDSNIIEVYIRYLRLKLEAQNEKRLIQTVRGIGYVLQEKL